MTVGVWRWPFSVDPLIPEAKRRARQRRLLLAAGVATAAALAVNLSQQPNGAPPSPVSAGSASPSKQLENQARLERGGPVRLLPGRVSTDALGIPASFKVFHHWYGEEAPGLLRLAKYLSSGGFEVSLGGGGIEVEILDSPLAQSARRLETGEGIRVHHVSSIRIGGHPGRRYSFRSNHLFELHRGDNIGTGEQDVILLGVGHRTLVIKNLHPGIPRAIPGHDQERREAERVIQSFQFRS
jgi:hypothetical protein